VKILVTGPESTGKTTISEYIAEHYDGIYIPEFAREYLEIHGPDYQEEDLLFFAKETIKRYHNTNKAKLEIYDTSMIDIVVWSLYKYGRCDTKIEDMTKQLDFDLILLATPEVPWTNDPLRENESNRQDLYDLFIMKLKELEKEFVILESDRVGREEHVKEIINRKL